MEKVKALWAVRCSNYGTNAYLSLCKFFEEKNIQLKTVGAYDGAEASKKILDNAIDLKLVVLDHDLPYLEIVENFLLGIPRKKFFIIRIFANNFQLEKIERKSLFQLKGDSEGPFHDIKEILEKIF